MFYYLHHTYNLIHNFIYYPLVILLPCPLLLSTIAVLVLSYIFPIPCFIFSCLVLKLYFNISFLRS